MKNIIRWSEKNMMDETDLDLKKRIGAKNDYDQEKRFLKEQDDGWG